MQIHYNESRGYCGSEVEEESMGSAPAAPLGLLAPGPGKPQGQDVASLGF